MIPGVVGFDIGIRTFARANVAIEVIVDTIDTTSDRVAREDDPLLPRPTAILSGSTSADGLTSDCLERGSVDQFGKDR